MYIAMKQKVLMFLMALLGLGTSAGATEFVSDLMVSTHTNQNTAMQQLTNAGYTCIEQDMNQGGGGQYVYIGYKTSTNLADAITGLLIVSGSSYAGDQGMTITQDGATFQAVRYTSDSKGGNLNRGRGSSAYDLYLYYTKYGNTTHVSASQWKPITGIAGTSSTTARTKSSYPTYVRKFNHLNYAYSQLENANLNEGGSASYYTYLNVMSTHVCSLGYAFTGTAQHKYYCTVCGYARSTAYCTFTAGSYTTQSPTQCYRVCTVCGLTTYYSHNWTNVYYQYTNTQHYTPCSLCGYRKVENHNFTNWAQYNATQHKHSCAICNYSEYAMHSWNYTYNSNTPSYHTKKCSVGTCGYSTAESHADVVDAAAVAATCTTAGSTEASHCSLCTYSQSATAIPPLGHMFDDYGVCTRTAGQKHYSHAQGDVTCDGEISLGDVTKLVHAVKSGHWANADYNGDGVLDLADIEALVNAILGK